jgi:sugar phosphate isomerase/epimerase
VQLRTHRQAWGALGPGGLHSDPAEFVAAVAARGYDAIEMPQFVLDLADDGEARMLDLLATNDLELVPMILTFRPTPEGVLDEFRTGIERAAGIGATLVVAHTGADHFDDDTAASVLGDCVRIGADHGIRVAQETHRSRILYNPWRTAAMLERVDGLWLNADFSHFVCVAERLLDDQRELMERLCDRAIHIHVRVGYENGPQVPDPRAIEWTVQLEAHENWWDRIWRAAADRGETAIGITPEYGPPTYAPVGTDPAQLWDICEWSTDRARDRFVGGAWRSVTD